MPNNELKTNLKKIIYYINTHFIQHVYMKISVYDEITLYFQ